MEDRGNDIRWRGVEPVVGEVEDAVAVVAETLSDLKDTLSTSINLRTTWSCVPSLFARSHRSTYQEDCLQSRLVVLHF